MPHSAPRPPICDSDPAAEQALDLSQVRDADLLDAWIRDRHRDSLQELVVRHSRMVHSVCVRRCRRPADAQDAYQNTFLILASNASEIREPASLAGWLHRVACRSATAETTHRGETPGADRLAEPVDQGPSPLELIARRHEAIALDETLAKLPDQYRVVIVLHELQEHSVAEIAESLGTTTGTVRGRLQRGRRLLATRLRRRGVVPVVALAATASTTVSPAAAAHAASDWAKSHPDPSFGPSAPGNADFSFLLQPETFAMRSTLTITTTATAGILILSAVLTTGGPPSTPAVQLTIAAPPDGEASSADAPDFDAPRIIPRPPTESMDGRPPAVIQREAMEKGMGRGAGMDQARGMRLGTPDADPFASASQPAKSLRQQLSLGDAPMISAVEKILENPADLPDGVDVEAFRGSLEQITGVPVLISPQTRQVARLDDAPKIEATPATYPLKLQLRQRLAPMGLKATATEFGIEMVPDHFALTRRGVDVDQWVNVDQKLMSDMVATLSKPVSLRFVDQPLDEVLNIFSRELNLPIEIDRRSLEALGLTDDTPTNLSVRDVPAHDALMRAIDDLDLTVAVKRSILTVTTKEAAEESPLLRIYWLDSLVGDDRPDRSLETFMKMFLSVNQPTWEALGGMGSLAIVQADRPGVLVSVDFETHVEIKQLLDGIRRSIP